MQFSTSCSPFIPANNNVNRVMRHVLYALIPAISVMFWLFGYSVLIQLLITGSSAIFAEALCLWLRKRAIKVHLFDLSAMITALLLALAIPSIAPWWIGVTGTLFAIIIGKHVYGGLGYNPFNPAMVGYVFLLVSFPLQMTHWQNPQVFLSLSDALNIILSEQLTLDGLSGATLLDSVKTHIGSGLSLTEINALPQLSELAGNGLKLVTLAYLLGGLWLLYQKVISWHIPLAVILGLCLPAALANLMDAAHYSSPLFHLSVGATLCAAFFIATDPVSAAVSNKGRLYYGAMIGSLIYIIRTWGGYPDGVAFAILLANLAAPSIDFYTRPKPASKQL